MNTSVKKMSKENIFSRTIARYMRNNFVKGLAIGIGAAIVIGTVVGVSIYFGTISVPEPNGNGNEPKLPYSTNLAQEIQKAIPNVVHVEIIGNATAAIHPNLIWAWMDRIGDNVTYSWNVTAQIMLPPFEIEFVLSSGEVGQIAQGLFDSINNTEKVGVYGQDPYPAVGEMPNLKWVTELYLQNSSVYFLYINMEGLILFQSTTWYGNYQYDANMIGADVLLPESAFDDYVEVLQNLFTLHM